MVKRLLAKEKIAGPNPVSRSEQRLMRLRQGISLLFERRWRRRQVARQGSAKPSPWVRFPSSPLMENARSFLIVRFCFVTWFDAGGYDQATFTMMVITIRANATRIIWFAFSRLAIPRGRNVSKNIETSAQLIERPPIQAVAQAQLEVPLARRCAPAPVRSCVCHRSL